MKQTSVSVKACFRSAMLMCFGAAAAAFLSVLVSSVLNPLYGQVDNYSVAMVVNRLWDQETYVRYMHPWLCALLAKLSDVLVHADAFMLFIHTLQFFCLFALFLLLYQSKKITGRIKLFGSLFILSVYSFMHIFGANYTIIACFSAVTGGLILLSGLSKPAPLRTVSGILFLSVGIMLRSEGAFLTLPYFLAELFIQLLQKKNRLQFVKRAAIPLTLCLVSAGVLVVSKAVTDHSPVYRASTEYSRLQSASSDYPHKPYEEVADLLDGVSKSEYTAATKWVSVDTETLNTDLYRAIQHAHSGMTVLDTDDLSFLQFLKRPAGYLLKNMQWTLFAGAAIILAALRLIFHSRLRALHAFMLIAGSIAIVLYFGLMGRANDRVWIPVVLCMLAYSAYAVIRLKKCPRFFLLSASFVLLAAFASTFFFSEIHPPVHALHARKDNQSIVLQDYGKEDTLYIWSDWHGHVSKKYAAAGKLPSKEFLRHNIPSGEWFYGQRYFKNHLHRIGVTNPARALFERGNTYMVSEKLSPLYETLFRDLYPGYAVSSAFPVNTAEDNLTAYSFQAALDAS